MIKWLRWPRFSWDRASTARLLWVSLASVLTFASFPTAWAPAVELPGLIWFSHVPLLWVLRDRSPGAAFRWGWLAGALITTGGYYWIAELLLTFGGLPWPVAYLGLILHSLQVGLIWGVWAWLCNRLLNTTSVGVEWVAPVSMVAIELAMPRIFPASMGNSQYAWPVVMQIADLVGVAGVTFLIYRVNAVLFLWLRARIEGRPRPRRALALTGLMLATSLGYGAARMAQFDRAMADAPTLDVGLVEGDVGIFDREPAERQRDHLVIQQKLSAQLEREGAELIVWSESSYRAALLPRDTDRLPPAAAPLPAHADDDQREGLSRSERTAPQRGFRTPLLFGGTSAEVGPKRWAGHSGVYAYNSAFLLDGEGQIQGRYDKNYLLVMGEYVPFAKHFPIIYQWIPAAGGLEAGDELRVIESDLWPDKAAIVRLGVLICYEGLLPRFVRPLGDQQPHALFNLTNDDWFGLTAERWLHLVLTIPRAIEHRVPLVRSTLTGVSTFVDANGRIIAHTQPTGAETLRWSVPLMHSRTVYQLIGESFSWLCLAGGLGLYFFGRWRRRARRPRPARA